MGPATCARYRAPVPHAARRRGGPGGLGGNVRNSVVPKERGTSAAGRRPVADAVRTAPRGSRPPLYPRSIPPMPTSGVPRYMGASRTWRVWSRVRLAMAEAHFKVTAPRCSAPAFGTAAPRVANTGAGGARPGRRRGAPPARARSAALPSRALRDAAAAPVASQARRRRNARARSCRRTAAAAGMEGPTDAAPPPRTCRRTAHVPTDGGRPVLAEAEARAAGARAVPRGVRPKPGSARALSSTRGHGAPACRPRASPAQLRRPRELARVPRPVRQFPGALAPRSRGPVRPERRNPHPVRPGRPCCTGDAPRRRPSRTGEALPAWAAAAAAPAGRLRRRVRSRGRRPAAAPPRGSAPPVPAERRAAVRPDGRPTSGARPPAAARPSHPSSSARAAANASRGASRCDPRGAVSLYFSRRQPCDNRSWPSTGRPRP